jgi:hypothetical protein
MRLGVSAAIWKRVSSIPRNYVIAIVSVRTISNMGKELRGLPYNSVKWASATIKLHRTISDVLDTRAMLANDND